MLFGIIGLNLWVEAFHFRCQKEDPLVDGKFFFNQTLSDICSDDS